MIAIEGRTCGEVFAEAAATWPDAPCLMAPGDGMPVAYTFAQTAEIVDRLASRLSDAGYGCGHRIALLLGTRPEHYFMKLAMAKLGISCVPVNPDYRPAELAYLLEDSGAQLGICDEPRRDLMAAGAAEAGGTPVAFYERLEDLPPAPSPPSAAPVTPGTEASLIYTSGTTGKPKGCICSHEYELMCGDAYRNIRPPIALRAAEDRVLNPLPAYHVNAGIITFWGTVICGACLIQPERFSAKSWWSDLANTGATIFHYLGVVIAVLMAERGRGPGDLGKVRAGLGAGVEPALHVAFEQRFGIPLIECWGMSEMCRVLIVDEEPRMIHTRAMGRPRADLEVRVVDRDDNDVPRGTPGEMVIRHSAETPAKGFFSGYLNKPEATAEAWRGGWFHTGDTVMQDESGMIHFVDRAKNIIRRSGENIAAAEVENCLFEDDRVDAVACVAVPDETREEEVMACIVLAPGTPGTEATARALFDHAFARLAYFKPPGWILFVDDLPVTGTQKVVKHRIFPEGEDPRRRPGVHDFRALKRRG